MFGVRIYNTLGTGLMVNGGQSGHDSCPWGTLYTCEICLDMVYIFPYLKCDYGAKEGGFLLPRQW